MKTPLGPLLVVLAVAPWPFGCAEDRFRYLLAGALLGIAAAWVARRRPAAKAVVLAATLPALALAQLALGRSVAPVATAEAVLVAVAMLATTAVVADRGRDPAVASRLAVAILGSCLLSSVFGVWQWSRDPQQLLGRFMTAPFATFPNHNHFAGLVEMGALLAGGMALGRARSRRSPTAGTVVLGGVALALAAAHLASRSRGGLVALVAGTAFLAWASAWADHGGPERDESPATRRDPGVGKGPGPGRGPGTRRAKRIATAGVVVAGLVFGLAAVSPDTRSYLGTVSRGWHEVSASYRVDVARDAQALVWHRPMAGWGLGAFADAFPAFKAAHGDVRTEHAENDALEYLVETGTVGAALAAWVLWLAACGFRAGTGRGQAADRRGLTLGAGSALVALGVHSVLDFNLHIPSNALVAASLLGLLLSNLPKGPPARPWVRRASAAALAIGAAAALWRAEGAWALDRATAQPGLQALDRVLSRHPYLAEAHRARAQAATALARSANSLAPARLRTASRDLESALRLRPLWAEAWGDLAWVRLVQGDRNGARVALENAVRTDPTALGLGLSLADLRFHLQGPEAAVADLVRLRRANSSWPEQAALEHARRWTSETGTLRMLRSP